MVVEDEKNIRTLISAILRSDEYNVVCAATAQEAYAIVASGAPDAILLDLGLPDKDGVELMREIREFSQVPILVLSAREQEREKVAALDAGADDYVVKPFGSSELLARIRAILRRNLRAQASEEPQTVSVGGLVIDYEKRLVTLDGEPIHFTPIEYKIVGLLGKNVGKVMTHDLIMRDVWGPYVNESQALRVNMANIRRKIEENPADPTYILTEVGVGYRLADLPS